MDDPVPQFTCLVKELNKRFPNLAYLHFVEPRIMGFEDIEPTEGDTNDYFRELWDGPFITNGGYDRTLAIEATEKNPKELVSFARSFIANVSAFLPFTDKNISAGFTHVSSTSQPDLPYRLLHNLPIIKADREVYYTVGTPEGYTDYPYVESMQDEAESYCTPLLQDSITEKLVVPAVIA